MVFGSVGIAVGRMRQKALRFSYGVAKIRLAVSRIWNRRSSNTLSNFLAPPPL